MNSNSESCTNKTTYPWRVQGCRAKELVYILRTENNYRSQYNIQYLSFLSKTGGYVDGSVTLILIYVSFIKSNRRKGYAFCTHFIPIGQDIINIINDFFFPHALTWVLQGHKKNQSRVTLKYVIFFYYQLKKHCKSERRFERLEIKLISAESTKYSHRHHKIIITKNQVIHRYVCLQVGFVRLQTGIIWTRSATAECPHWGTARLWTQL